MEKLFEKALRGKYRYNFRGMITTEDLWDLKLKDLDLIYSQLNSELKKTEEIGLLSVENRDTEILKTKMEIVKHIFVTKKEEIDAHERAVKNKIEKQKILEVLARKKEDILTNKSVEELEEMLKNL